MTTLTIPTISISQVSKGNPNIVLIPEIFYKITANKLSSLELISQFAPLLDLPKYSKQNSPFGPIIRTLTHSKPKFPNESFEGIESLKSSILGSNNEKNLRSKKANDVNEPWFLLVIVSDLAVIDSSKKNNGPVVGTICRLMNISNDTKNSSKVILSIRAIGRAEILNDKIFDRKNSSQESVIFHSTEVVPYLNEYVTDISPKAMKPGAIEAWGSFVERIEKLFTNIHSFKETYNTAFTPKNKEVDAVKVLVRLSPLASVINEILRKDKTMKNVEDVFHKIVDRISDSGIVARGKPITDVNRDYIFVAMLKIYDLVVGVIPVTGTHKYGYLQCVSPLRRIQEAGPDIIEKVTDILSSFETHYDFVMKDFISAENEQEKMKLAIDHVKALKEAISIFKNKPQFSNKASSENKIKTIKSGGNEGKHEDDDEDETTKIMREFYSKLVASPSPIEISFDGAKLLKKDFKRYFKMSKNPVAKNSSEFQVLSNYLEIVIDLPWSADGGVTKIIDLNKAKKQLEDDHYGLYSVKDRLLEYLGVLNLQNKINQFNQEKPMSNDVSTSDITSSDSQIGKKKEPNKKNKKLSNFSKAPILCLAGPPGVGKTSLAKSVATTLGRKFQRISLGGLSDEAEIRGHRRTYVSAMPGLIISALRKAKTLNPVILLDEIDKLGASAASRGDPQAAMLEVLDPEQNSSFKDHYLGFPVDLSQVLFLCTANDLRRLHPALLDRMEVIHLTGYNYMDKVQIVRRYLLPKQLKKNILPAKAVEIVENDTILKIIVEYTNNESGIRNLERQISTLCRKKALEFSSKINAFNDSEELPPGYTSIVTKDDLPHYLGIPNYYHTSKKNRPLNSRFTERYGMVNGLSYNSDGTGSILVFETIAIPNVDRSSTPGTLTMTGKLGEVLTESVKISSSFVKLILSKNLIAYEGTTCQSALNTLKTHQIHLHAPEGAISKDGPSAGITITLALLSLLLKKSVPNNVAMTGEMTLRGIILPIGGVKEKLLGAHLAGTIDTVLVPRANRGDLIEHYISNLQTDDKDQMNQELRDVLKNDKQNIHNCDIFDKPEQFILESLGIRIHYVEDFWDVIQVVWNGEVGAKSIIEEIPARL
ncbi:hypothetical protein DASC09_058040 [Saccharomycopsis crataegensis]|uniref:endopeptidase La n=1 Tax=Saccharomycopsis crataegensis TaxID=43959 RepID=A0AAV5QWB3_9ASCO|nr:hypothetical protein DASC09_058040 [Saccharomycopsis crataegensis]